ncbi:hypothetical protein [uncultured Pelagimonas sp.]|uniref:hypothetical protein n=1 Tax=uncultured Pelagimonas sp. TaxID=1618102 RepID=UPI0026298BE3|nr:hypothetical protein [uncultured Pelagimonas sp.]
MRKLTLAAFLSLVPIASSATPLSSALPGAEIRGQASLRYLGVKIYDAKLFTKGGSALDWSQDFALELTYKRNLSQYDLVEATLREMSRMGNAMPIRTQLETCYQAVAPGDRYLAISSGPDQLRFWRNDRAACTLSQKGIKTKFMEIFLGDNSRSRRFSRALLGQ